MKIYHKIALIIYMKHAKNQIEIPSIFKNMAPVTPQTCQCLLVPGPKNRRKLYRGVGIVGCTDGRMGRPRVPTLLGLMRGVGEGMVRTIDAIDDPMFRWSAAGTVAGKFFR